MFDRCYVEDVGSVADSLTTRPVVIGHSLGGFVVQRYLESHDAHAGVLLASMSYRGSSGFFLRLMKAHPWLTMRTIITGKSLPHFNRPKLVRESFFCAQTPESIVVRCAARLEDESAKVPLDTMLHLPRPERVTAPLVVVGGECDGIVTADEVHATARAYRTEAEFFPDMGHDTMLEPGWEPVAERIPTWLGTRDL